MIAALRRRRAPARVLRERLRRAPDHRARAVAPQPRPRRPARPRRHSRRRSQRRPPRSRALLAQARLASAAAAAGEACARDLGHHGGLDRPPGARAGRRVCRCSRATAASSRRPIRRSSTSWRTLRDESRRADRRAGGALSRRYRESSSLKIRHNNVLGYYVEATSTHADKLLKDTRLHPPPDDGQRARASPPWSSAISRPAIASAADKALGARAAPCSTTSSAR